MLTGTSCCACGSGESRGATAQSRALILSPDCPQVGIGGTLALAGTGNPDVAWIGENAAWIALFFMCFYICAYAWSWGPLPWLYAAEVQFLETRSAGQSIATLINLLFSFVIGQVSAERSGICVRFPGPMRDAVACTTG